MNYTCRLDRPVRNGEDAAGIAGIGKKIALKSTNRLVCRESDGIVVQEIIDTGTCEKIKAFDADERIQTLKLFGRIWGACIAVALHLTLCRCRCGDGDEVVCARLPHSGRSSTAC